MSRDKGYLQTISCSISLSSCRVRAESLARALNIRLWPRPVFGLDPRSNTTYDKLLVAPGGRAATSCSGMAEVIDKPPHAIDMFKTGEGYEVGHCWVNEMPPEDDESYDTPPCSSPPSPADDEIIVNPPSQLPFCTTFLKDFAKNADSKCNSDARRNHSIFSDEAKLRDKLQQYADSLLLTEDGPETFYDASENEVKDDGLASTNRNTENSLEDTIDHLNQNSSNETEENVTGYLVSDKDDTTYCVLDTTLCNAHPDDLSTKSLSNDNDCSTNILIEVNPPTNTRVENSSNGPDSFTTKTPLVDRRVREVQELEEDDRPKLLRSTSLKTGKTPPGTPSRKKIVRFADVLGLDLEAVRHIVCDDVPNVPSSAFDDLHLPPEKIEPKKPSSNRKTTVSTWSPVVPTVINSALSNLHPLFSVPGNDPDFLDRVRKDMVCLESITVSVLSVHCVCRVLNISYEKYVSARYTTDEWRTWDEVLASYVPFSSNGEFDRFSFSLYLKPGTQVNQCLSFAIRYTAAKSVRWDNNKGTNYTLRYTGNENASNLLLTTHEVGDTWLHHFC